MKALIVFCELPEEVKLYVVNDVDDQLRNTLLSFHGVYVNSCDSDDDLQQQVNNFFFTDDGKYKFQPVERPIVDEKFDIVIQCGFYL